MSRYDLLHKLRSMNPYRIVRYFAWSASMLGLSRGPHITRYFMYGTLETLGARLPAGNGRALCVSQSTHLVEVMGLRPVETVSADYPAHNLLSLRFPDASFDWVLSDQVLEHVEGNPQTAIDECRRVLRPGGIAVHTTCLINPIHGAPSDFWRFTPDGLSLLHRGWSEILEAGGWGNLQVWNVIQDGIRFAGVPHARWHPLHRLAMKNDPLWPIVTWIVARK